MGYVSPSPWGYASPQIFLKIFLHGIVHFGAFLHIIFKFGDLHNKCCKKPVRPLSTIISANSVQLVYAEVNYMALCFMDQSYCDM